MNRGVLQSSPVQQMMAGNPNWPWSINTMRPPTHHLHHHHQHHQQQASSSPNLMPPHHHHHQPVSFFPHQYTGPTSSSSSSSSSSLPIPSWHDNQEQLPESWSQLLLGGLVGEEEKYQVHQQQQAKKLENVWEEQALHQAAAAAAAAASNASVVDVKQENSGSSSYVFGHANSHEDHFHQTTAKPTAAAWSTASQIMASSSSPKSSISTNFSSNMLDFSGNLKAAAAAAAATAAASDHSRNPAPDRSSECNSSPTTGGALKKARVQPSATQSTFKVRKEKLGDRITALHQLVSPFGKTDTASVLLEAIGYIRFLQSQIEALSLPYLGSGSGNMRQQQSVQGERNSIFPEDPGQLLNDNCMKRKGGPDQQDCHEEPKKDLRSRGLCLVPVSCTLQVGSDNGADYWAPAALGGSFR